jgi:isoamylase
MQFKVLADPDAAVGIPRQEAWMDRPIAPGRSYPLGATLRDGGVNFSVFSKHSAGVELCLFDHVDDARPARVIALDPRMHRTYHYWHVFVPDIAPGQLYGFRVQGLFDPANGLRFDASKVLLDPYGKCIARPAAWSRQAARRPGDNAVTAFKSVVVDPSAYDWEDDAPPRHPFERTVIYEMHVGRFTRHANSGVTSAERGTYTGVIHKIPHLQDLGVTAVELLPVFAFDEQDAPAGLVNDWGYQPLSFFAPHPGYGARRAVTEVLDDFRGMVKALHRAGIEVILDVVYNHTTEGGADGPTICFRGLANETYYILGENKATYADYAGTGNTLNANEPIVRRMILDSLRYWVSEMHVDGFRFDLAAILSRDQHGRPMAAPPLIWDIESDPVLANVKLIAEAWDAGGLYQLGNFAGDAWKEWNGKFRDDVRSFIKSDDGLVRALACRLTGSPDVYAWEQREPEQSINFVTCHDGFTLNDLVSYDAKHNEANGDQNRDGTDNNYSWNCGVEGPTDDPAIEKLRTRQIKNFLALTLLSVGTPMLLAGDEMRHRTNLVGVIAEQFMLCQTQQAQRLTNHVLFVWIFDSLRFAIHGRAGHQVRQGDLAHVLDIHLNKVARSGRCTYTRYVDDLTFSTNEKEFPASLARLKTGSEDVWAAGDSLVRYVYWSGFKLNHDKTRMQQRDSRQDTTGLIVNKKINVRNEYYKIARAKCDHLFQHGFCYSSHDGRETAISDDMLEGAMSFICHIRGLKTVDWWKEQKSFAELYRKFLDYRAFYDITRPRIICEGKTDNIYLRSAMNALRAKFPELINPDPTVGLRVDFFNCTNASASFQKLSGGSDQLKNLLVEYRTRVLPFKHGTTQPVIMIVDNDSGLPVCSNTSDTY